MPGQELVDFAFGGDGTGLFLRDNGEVRHYEEGFGEWDTPLSNPGNFYGMAETENGPGYIRQNDELIQLMDSKTNDPAFEIGCTCTTAFGHSRGLVGWDDDSVYYNTSMTHKKLDVEKIGSHYMIQNDGSVMEFSHAGLDGIVVHDGNTTSKVDVDESIVNELAAGAKSSRNPYNSFFGYNAGEQSGALGLGDDGLPINIPAPRSGTGVVGLSGGLGQIWWVLENTIVPMSAPDRYFFVLKNNPSPIESGMLQLASEMDSSDAAPEDPVINLLDASEIPEGVQWRFVTSLGEGDWHPLTEASEFPDESEILIEIMWPSAAGFPKGSPLLVGTNDQDEHNFPTPTDYNCDDCLVPIGDQRILDAGGTVWLDPEGYLPGNKDNDWQKGGVLVQYSEDDYFLTGTNSDAPWSHNVSLGLPWRALAKSDSTSEEYGELEFQVIEGPDGTGVLIGEEPKKESNKDDIRGANPIEFYGVEGILYHLNPRTGQIDCQMKTGDVNRDNQRILQHHPYSGFYGMGSGFGRLSALNQNCDALWESEALETGAVLHTTVPSSRSPLPGPVVVDVDVTLDVEGLDEVQIHFLGHSFRSTYGGPVSPVWMNAHLQYWLPLVHDRDDQP